MRQLRIIKQITNREAPSLDKYLLEIGKIHLLNCDEEIFLSQQIKEGNRKALDALVKSNLRFVISVAKQYQNQGLPLSDLINEGNLGLIKAAARFDSTKGFKNSLYILYFSNKFPQTRLLFKDNLSLLANRKEFQDVNYGTFFEVKFSSMPGCFKF